MRKSVTITVHPASLTSEYLSVSDAMLQVLDFISALDACGGYKDGTQNIVWRLTEAHTNSPPFTITTEAYASDPVISIAFEADRVAAGFYAAMDALSGGRSLPDFDGRFITPVRRLLSRNLNGIGKTDIVSKDQVFSIVPATAKTCLITIEKMELDLREAVEDLRRTEFGSVELVVYGLTQWNNKRALSVVERLTGNKLTCVLENDVADALGGAHTWSEAWQDRRILAVGSLHYGRDGVLKRVDAEDAEDMPYTDVSLADLEDIDLLQGRSVSDHLQAVREL